MLCTAQVRLTQVTINPSTFDVLMATVYGLILDNYPFSGEKGFQKKQVRSEGIPYRLHAISGTDFAMCAMPGTPTMQPVLVSEIIVACMPSVVMRNASVVMRNVPVLYFTNVSRKYHTFLLHHLKALWLHRQA